MGAGLGLALSAAGHEVTLLVRTPRPTPSGVGLSVGDHSWPGALADAEVVLLATPDAAITRLAESLAGTGAVGPRHVVLHTSGLLDREALSPLERTGAALGSLHPLQAVSDPSSAPVRLSGAYAAVEGDERAMAVGARLAESVGMTAVAMPAAAKPAYHAAAAMASNYTVTLLDVARRIAVAAGIPARMAELMYLPLLRGTAENLVQYGPVAALTGAIRRGDAETVAAHVAALEPRERRLYAMLGLETLELAGRAGLDVKAAEAVETVLRRSLDPG